MNPSEDKVLAVVEGVEGVGNVSITEKMVKVFAKRRNDNFTEDNTPGFVASIAGYVTGGAGGEEIGQLSGDAYLFESPETRELFAPVRRAYELRTTGAEKPESQYSRVSIVEVIPDWEEFSKTL